MLRNISFVMVGRGAEADLFSYLIGDKEKSIF